MSNSTGRARRGRTIAGREEPAGLCCRPARLALSTARQAKSDYPKPRDETAALPGAKCGGRACPIKATGDRLEGFRFASRNHSNYGGSRPAARKPRLGTQKDGGDRRRQKGDRFRLALLTCSDITICSLRSCC